MKRLRKIALNLDRSDWPNDYGYAFYLRSRSLCNYIERSLRRIDVQAVNSTKLCITGHSSDSSAYSINSSNVACLEVPFSLREYNELQSSHEINAFMVQFLQSRLALIPSEDAGDIEPILGLIQQFSEEGYINEWQHKGRIFSEHGLKISLQCTLTTSDFELHIETVNKNGFVFQQKLLRTDPDEMAFHHRYKDILLEDDHVVITSRQIEPLCRIPLTDLDHTPNTTEQNAAEQPATAPQSKSK